MIIIIILATLSTGKIPGDRNNGVGAIKNFQAAF